MNILLNWGKVMAEDRDRERQRREEEERRRQQIINEERERQKGRTWDKKPDDEVRTTDWIRPPKPGKKD